MTLSEISIQKLDSDAAQLLPVPISSYVVAGRGERFPFLNQHAKTFFYPPPQNPDQAHAAQLQALAFTEKWGYQIIAENGVRLGGPVYSTGSVTQSSVLCQTRACVLNKPVVLCRSAGAAFGAAILAASSERFSGDLAEAIRCTVHIDRVIEPEPHPVPRYGELYVKFRADCRSKGYDS